MFGEKIFERKNSKFVILFLVVITALVYANSLTHKFVCDDIWVIENNDFVKSWKNFPLLFTRQYLTDIRQIGLIGIRNIGSGELTYRPVVTATYFLDYSIGKLNPFGYHLTNVLLHISNTILLYFLSTSILKDKKLAFISSLLFALHPVNAEAVNVVSSREDLLAFLFFVSSFILFLKSQLYSGFKKICFHNFSVILFLFALFSKEMAITLPFLIMTYDYLFISKINARAFFLNFKDRYLGYVCACVFYLLIWGGVMHSGISTADITHGNLYHKLSLVVMVIGEYIKWILFPLLVHPTLSYEYFISLQPSIIRILFAASLIAACFIVALKTWKSSREIAFSLMWFFITLLPVSNLLPLYNIIACRYLYIPIAGFSMFLVLSIYRLPESISSKGFQRIFKKIRNIAIPIIITAYLMFTPIKNMIWSNNISLWLCLAESYPKSAETRSGLAAQFLKKGFIDKAIAEYQTAIGLDPNSGEYHNGLGNGYYCKDRLDEAIVEYGKALTLNPRSPGIYSNLGSVYVEKGLYKEARSYFEAALNIDPKYTPAINGLGVTYKKVGDKNTAKKLWQKSLKIYQADNYALDELKSLSDGV